MTVSRVINGEDNVRQETREAVQAAIAKLRYSPNQAARTLAGAEQVRIGMLYSNPSAAFLSEFLVGTLEQARLSHVQLVVEKCDVDQHEDKVVRELLATGVDGIILPPPLCDSKRIHAVITRPAHWRSRSRAQPARRVSVRAHRRPQSRGGHDASYSVPGAQAHRLHHRQSRSDRERATPRRLQDRAHRGRHSHRQLAHTPGIVHLPLGLEAANNC